jgi:hypothetical protein
MAAVPATVGYTYTDAKEVCLLAYLHINTPYEAMFTFASNGLTLTSL